MLALSALLAYSNAKASASAIEAVSLAIALSYADKAALTNVVSKKNSTGHKHWSPGSSVNHPFYAEFLSLELIDTKECARIMF